MQCGLGTRAITVTAFQFEFMLQLRIAVENISLWSICDEIFELSHFLFDGLQVVRRAQTFFENRCALVKIGNLVECADLQLRLARYGTGIRLEHAGDDFEKGGLSRT